MIVLNGRVALVTAASRGLGAEIARQLAKYGAEVAFTYLQNADAAKALAGEVESPGRKSEPGNGFPQAAQVVELTLTAQVSAAERRCLAIVR